MLLLYSDIKSPRLEYIADVIFSQLLGINVSITDNQSEYLQFEGPSINYSKNRMSTDLFFLQSQGLLSEVVIQTQALNWFQQDGHKAFFKTTESDYAFDILAASFYLITRYEEYLPYTPDAYGRYPHEASAAFKENLLDQPIVNSWVIEFSNKLKQVFPTLQITTPAFSFLPTYDIDIAYSYSHKGLLRNLAGFLKHPSLERIQVLLKLKQDPFDSYQWLNQLHTQYHLNPIYFFLVADKNKGYDKNILPHHAAMKRLIAMHGKKYQLGVHPSWQSGDEEHLLKNEMDTIANVIQQKVTSSRQHYIRFTLPEGYRSLLHAGIENDFSMGYGSINGFRASVATPFFWYDLENECTTLLKVHPFCFMEANSYYEQHFTLEQTSKELNHYYQACKAVNGQMITIWHNHFLGTDKMFEGWKELYQNFIKTIIAP